MLDKALMLYNFGVGKNDRNAKVAMVDRLRTDKAKFTKSGALEGTHYGYIMAIKKWSWVMRRSDGGYLPYRTYIWKGGQTAGGQDWCFAYGEKEWVSGKLFDKVRAAAIGSAIKSPVGRFDCETGVPL